MDGLDFVLTCYCPCLVPMGFGMVPALGNIYAADPQSYHLFKNICTIRDTEMVEFPIFFKQQIVLSTICCLKKMGNSIQNHSQYLKRFTNAALGQLQAFHM